MKTGRLPLLALRAFEVTGRHLSVKEAAAALFLTPSAISQQVRTLESRLGVELFVRGHRQLSFTKEGQRLFFVLRESFAQIEHAMNEIDNGSTSRKIKFKLLPTFAMRWFMPRIPSFICAHPELEVEIATTANADDASLDDVDFASRYGEGDWPDVEAHRIFDEEWVVVCAPALAIAIRHPEDVLKHTLLHSTMRQDAWSIWLAKVGASGREAVRNQHFATGALALQAAIDGVGIAVAQRAYLAPELDRSTLVQPFKMSVKTERGYYLVSSRRKSDQTKIRQFREWLGSQPQ